MKKRINDFINENLWGLMAGIVIVSVMLLILIFAISDKYDDELFSLREENKLLKQETSEQKKQLTEQINAIDYLLENKECNCGFYEDFYYDNAEGCGALE